MLPGFVALWGLSFQVEAFRRWLGQSAESQTTIGGFLYVTLVALIFGLLASTVRWMVIDFVHHQTGIKRPNWNYGRLQQHLAAYTLLEESHYRYYQFYGNTIVAGLIGYLAWRTTWDSWFSVADLMFVGVILVLYFGSRDTLQKYYRRVNDLLS